MTPLLTPNPLFTEKEKGSYVMEINQQFFRIDDEAKLVLSILSQTATYKEATEMYSQSLNEEFKEEDFTLYAQELLAKFKLDESPKSFLTFEKIIISKKYTKQLSAFISWAFNPIYFWITFLGLVAFSTYTIFSVEDHHNHHQGQVNVLYFIIGFLATVLLHELGHVAACRKFTGKNSGIGIGLYLIFPIFYSDISSIWHSSKNQKIITNLAGIYMQLWCALIVNLLGLYFGIHALEDFSKTLMFVCFIQILPFVRSDGYWLLSDLFDVPNLLKLSSEKVSQLFTQPKQTINALNKKNLLILSYGLLNYAFLIWFTYIQVTANRHFVVTLPYFIWTSLLNLFKGDWNSIDFQFNYMYAFLFYYVAFTYLNLFYKRTKKKFK